MNSSNPKNNPAIQAGPSTILKLNSKKWGEAVYHTCRGSSPGPEKDAAERLLARAAEHVSGRVLLLFCGGGAVLSQCIQHANSMVSIHMSWEDYTCEKASFSLLRGKFPHSNVDIQLKDLPNIPDFDTGFDAVLLRILPGSELIDACINLAGRCLKSGGIFIACGRRQEGIKRLEKRAKLIFGAAQEMLSKSHCRLSQYKKNQALNVSGPSAYHQWISHQIPISASENISYQSKPGVFSYRKTDPGTGLLLTCLPDFKEMKVLDACCGAGVLGLAARTKNAKQVCFLDNSMAGLEAVCKNLGTVPIPDIQLYCGSLFGQFNWKFDIILINPPFHRQKQTATHLGECIVNQCYSWLKENGSCYLVANAFLPYERFGRKVFDSAEVLLENPKYRVFRFTKSSVMQRTVLN